MNLDNKIRPKLDHVAELPDDTAARVHCVEDRDPADEDEHEAELGDDPWSRDELDGDHLYLGLVPSPGSLDDMFESEEEHDETTDHIMSIQRLDDGDITKPKGIAEWVNHWYEGEDPGNIPYAQWSALMTWGNVSNHIEAGHWPWTS